MTAAEHYAEAERIALAAQSRDRANAEGFTGWTRLELAALAQVHATLAVFPVPVPGVTTSRAGAARLPARPDPGAEGRADRAAAELILDLAQPGMSERYRNENADKLVCRTHTAGPTLARLARDKANAPGWLGESPIEVERAIERLGLGIAES